MIRKMGLLLSAAALAMPGEAAAQQWFVGAGPAFTAVRERETDESAVRPGVHLLLGRRVWRGATTEVAVGVEGSAYGLGDQEPEANDFFPGTSTPQRRPLMAGTQVLLAYVQVKTVGIYLRPGVGIGRHAFPVYTFGAGNEVVDASASHEAGPAVGITAGYSATLSRRVSLGVESVAVLSKGEDSSGARNVFGLRIVPTIRL